MTKKADKTLNNSSMLQSIMKLTSSRKKDDDGLREESKKTRKLRRERVPAFLIVNFQPLNENRILKMN